MCSAVLYTPTPALQKEFGMENDALLSLCVPLHECMCVCMCPGRGSTSGFAEEDEAPDTGGAADDKAHCQHCAVRHPPAQPAHKEEAQDDLHPTQAVHQAVA